MSRRKCIAIFSAYYPPHLGGVELYTRNLAKELIRLGHEVAVVTSSLEGNGFSTRMIHDEEIDVHPIPSISVMGDRFPLIVPGLNLMSTVANIKKMSIDYIVINTRYYPLSLLGCWIAKTKGINPVIIDHSSGPLSNDKSVFGSILRGYERVMTVLLKRQDPAMCSVSEKGLCWLKTLGFSPLGVIHNAINANAYRDLASARSWRKELGCGDDTLLVAFAGRLIPEKGVFKAIEAINRLGSSGCKVRLAIAGDGDLRSQIQSMQNEYVSFVGRLPQQDVSALLRDADCFCLPTDYPEGLPTILLEAGAWGNSVVTSNCAGAREIIPDGDHGIILEENNVDDLEIALRMLYSHEGLRKLFGQKLKRHIDLHFSWRSSADSLMKILEPSS